MDVLTLIGAVTILGWSIYEAAETFTDTYPNTRFSKWYASLKKDPE